jgi:predicted transcriptional regulator
MKQIGVSVPDELKEKLEELAKEKERSMSWVIRDILQNYIDSRAVCCKEEE